MEALINQVESQDCLKHSYVLEPILWPLSGQGRCSEEGTKTDKLSNNCTLCSISYNPYLPNIHFSLKYKSHNTNFKLSLVSEFWQRIQIQDSFFFFFYYLFLFYYYYFLLLFVFFLAGVRGWGMGDEEDGRNKRLCR